MKLHTRSAGFALATVAACAALVFSAAPSDSATTKAPVASVVYVPANSNPPVPTGLKVACMPGPNVLTPSKTCPVIKYLGLTTWAYSFIDNRVSLAFVTYDANNTVVMNTTKDGARYVWNMASGIKSQIVTAVGQSNQHVTITWAELTPPPQIATVASNSGPTPPAGLKVACMTNGSSLQSGPTCPVVKYQGNTTWAYSYMDNRVSLAFVTYGPSGNVVRNVEMKGTRYVWQMASSAANSTVTATGQGNSTVSAPWSQFGQ